MLDLTAKAEIYTRGVTIMKRTLAVLIICGLALSGCGKTETDGAELRAGKTESASAASTVTTAPVSTASSVKTTAVKTTSKTSAKTTVKTTSESTAKSTEKKSGTKKSSKKADVTTQAPRYGNEQDNNGNYQTGGNNGGQTQPQSPNTTASRKTEKPSQTQKKTTTAKKTEKPKPKPTEAPEPEPQGLSQADISEINGYIKQAAKSYGIGTECPDCNNEGAVILSGYVDPWNGYSWDTPIAGDFHETVSEYKTGVDSRIKTMYSEWLDNGETKEDISECIYIYIYWEKQDDGTYDLYLMW